jgi:hypothetical protein
MSDTDLHQRLWTAIEDPGVQSIQLTLMNNPGRGEDVAYQAVLRPVDATGGTCFSILRTPKAAIRRMLDQWDAIKTGDPVPSGHEPDTPDTTDIEDLLG